MDSFGAMWLDTSRAVHGRSALSVELLYADDDDSSLSTVAERVSKLRQWDAEMDQVFQAGW